MTRTAIVTGANRGIGLAIAPKLAELGHQVLLGSRDLKAGEDAVQSLRRPDLNLEPVQIDLTSAATVAMPPSEPSKSLAARLTRWSTTLACCTKNHSLS